MTVVKLPTRFVIIRIVKKNVKKKIKNLEWVLRVYFQNYNLGDFFRNQILISITVIHTILGCDTNVLIFTY